MRLDVMASQAVADEGLGLQYSKPMWEGLAAHVNWNGSAPLQTAPNKPWS